MVLPFQHLPALQNHQQQEQHGQGNGNACHHHRGGGLELAHAGVHHVGGHSPQNGPALKTGRLIDQIVGPSTDIKHHCAGMACQKVLVQGGNLLVGQAF